MANPGATARNWKQVILRASAEVEEAIGAFCWEAGAVGLEVVDRGHPTPPPDLPAGEIELRACFSPATDWPRLLESLKDFLARTAGLFPGARFGEPRLIDLTDEDWRNNWKKHFQPLRVGRFFIYPGWETPGPAEDFPVRIDPGMAFGTGLHPTTRLCLREMETLLPFASFLDLGCGTGILALAAARAGVSRVVAVDNDPEACEVARENAAKNGLAARLEIRAGTIDAVAGRFEVIAANILSGVLIQIAPALAGRLQPGGTLLLSGILHTEAEAVLKAYLDQGLCRGTAQSEDEWTLLRLQGPHG